MPSGPADTSRTRTQRKARSAREARAAREARSASPARQAPLALPSPLAPMLASTDAHEPGARGWVYEPKWDGIRLLLVAEEHRVRLLTRNGNDKAAQFPEVAEAARQLVAEWGAGLVLDGELVATDERGAPLRFQALQSRIHARTPRSVAKARTSTGAAFIAFDLLADGAESLVGEPWTVRRERLEALLPAPGRTERGGVLRLGRVDRRGGRALLRRAQREGWEGLIAKRADAVYRPGVRSGSWVKLKLERQQELVVGGFTEPRNTREHIGALLVGHHDATGKLVYAGHVGTGFTRASLRALHERLAPLRRATSPFTTTPPTNEPATWVRPVVVVEVRFNEWTEDGRLRQPVFLGVRDDKAAKDVVREDAGGAATDEPPSRRAVRDRPARGAAARSATRAGSRATEARHKARKRAARGGGHPLGEPFAGVVRQLEALEANGARGELQLPEGALPVSNLDKRYFPEAGLTKGDLMRHYLTVAPFLLPAIADRPLVLRRHPDGIHGEAFYQQQAPEGTPPAVRVEEVGDPETGDEPRRRFVGGDLATLLHLVQLGAISVDPWHGRVSDPGSADWSVIDLDPGPRASFGRVVEVALLVHEELERMGLTSVPKTSGASGLHVMVPLVPGTPAEAARLLAQIVATAVVKRAPRGLATITRAVSRRPAAAIYVDYLQNIAGKTVASVYAARARPEATVSTPLEWDEVTPALDPREFTLTTLPERLVRTGDLWEAGMRNPNDLFDGSWMESDGP